MKYDFLTPLTQRCSQKDILQHSMGKGPKLIEENKKLEPPQMESTVSPYSHLHDERKLQRN